MTPAEMTELREELMEEQRREMIEAQEYNERLQNDEDFAVDEIVAKHNIVTHIQDAVRELNDIGWSYDGESLLHELRYML